MVKSTICFVISVICIMLGAFIINEGFGMIVTGAWFLVGSYVEYTKEEKPKEETKEETKVLRDPWHPTCQIPDRDAEIIFRSSKDKSFEPAEFYVRSLNVYAIGCAVRYSWGKYCKNFGFDEWAYIDELI